MLIKPDLKQINDYKEYAYALSQDLSRSSFPTYLDGIKTKEDFMSTIDNALKGDISEILLYAENDQVLGWIHYYWLEDDKYIGFDTFDIERNTGNAIDEFLEYINDRFHDYQICFGFPEANTEAIGHLKEIGFIKAEESDVFVLDFRNYQLKPESGCIVEVNDKNYDDFRKLHDGHQDMYWNSDRLYHAMMGVTKDPWHLYLCYEDDRPVGNIYFVYAENMMEIFGIDVIGGSEITRQLLIKSLNRTKEDGIGYMTFFA